jgi:hypothetical protein
LAEPPSAQCELSWSPAVGDARSAPVMRRELKLLLIENERIARGRAMKQEARDTNSGDLFARAAREPNVNEVHYEIKALYHAARRREYEFAASRRKNLSPQGFAYLKARLSAIEITGPEGGAITARCEESPACRFACCRRKAQPELPPCRGQSDVHKTAPHTWGRPPTVGGGIEHL